MGISREQALDCLRSDDLIGIGMEADAVRRKLHPEGVASYSLECGIDCAGVRAKGGSADFDALCTEIYAQASEALETGATGIVLDELSARATGTGMLESLFLGIKQRYPSIWLQALNAPEINRIAATSGLGARETLMRLRDAGLDAIGAEGMVLADPDGWIEVHRAAHGLGMSTTAAMVFGGGETMEQRVDCLEAVRQLQEGTGGFAAFIPLSFHSSNGRILDDATAVESLKMLAVSRVMLDNIENVQSSRTTQGLKVRQMGLRFGGNDVGSAMPGESGSEEDLRRIIRDVGFVPVRRDSLYRTMFLN